MYLPRSHSYSLLIPPVLLPILVPTPKRTLSMEPFLPEGEAESSHLSYLELRCWPRLVSSYLPESLSGSSHGASVLGSYTHEGGPAREGRPWSK